LELHTSINKKGQHVRDVPIMEGINTIELSSEELLSINKCRLYLRAWFLSDITDGSGVYVLQEAWNGDTQSHPLREKLWPNQGKPTKAHWHIWQQALQGAFLGRGRKLRVPLGPWTISEEEWEWFYSTKDGQLYRCTNTDWLKHSIIMDRPI
jgi:hypothetical protein